MMVKRVSKSMAVLLFVILAVSLQAQTGLYDDESQSRWVSGGGFGLSISNYGSNLQLAPILGYRITPRLEAGMRLNYNFFSYKQFGSRFRSHNYGGGPYSSFTVFRGLFAHAEYEALSYQGVFVNAATQSLARMDRKWVHSVFVGGGYRQYFSSNSYALMLVLFNLNETFDSPYANPTFRIGFGFGL